MVNSASLFTQPTFYKTGAVEVGKTIFSHDVEMFLNTSKNKAIEIIEAYGDFDCDTGKKELSATIEFKAKLHAFQKQSHHNEHLKKIEKIVHARERIFTPTHTSFWNVALIVSAVSCAALLLVGAAFASMPCLALGLIGALAVGGAFIIKLAIKPDLDHKEADAKLILDTVEELWNAQKPVFIPVKQASAPVTPPPMVTTVDSAPEIIPEPVIVQQVKQSPDVIVQPVIVQHVKEPAPLFPVYLEPAIPVYNAFNPYYPSPSLHTLHSVLAPSPAVVVTGPSMPPRHHHGSYIPNRVPSHSPIEIREIPGHGRREGIRHAAAALSSVGIPVIHKPSLIATQPSRPQRIHMPYAGNAVVPGHNSFAHHQITHPAIPLSRQNHHHSFSQPSHHSMPLSQQGRAHGGFHATREVPGHSRNRR